MKYDTAMSLADGRSIAVIAAVASNGVIGGVNGVPWTLPDDLRHFRRLTTGHTVVMGRRTWDRIGKPLPDRQNIVVSQTTALQAGAERAHSLRQACQMSSLKDPIFVIGGSRLYEEALVVASKLFLTEINRAFDGDVLFPQYEREDWIEIARKRNTCVQPVPFTFDFVEYVRSRLNNGSSFRPRVSAT